MQFIHLVYGIQINVYCDLTKSLCPHFCNQTLLQLIHLYLWHSNQCFKIYIMLKDLTINVILSFFASKHESSLSIFISGNQINTCYNCKNKTFLGDFPTMCVTMIIRETSPTFLFIGHDLRISVMCIFLPKNSDSSIT